MYFALTQEQDAIAASVRAYLSAHPAETPTDTNTDGFSRKLWKMAGELGWTGVMVHKNYGGTGLGLVDLHIVGRELGFGAVPLPWRGTVLAAEGIRLTGDEVLRQRWLPALARGSAIGAVAWQVAGADGWRAVEYAEAADVLVLVGGSSISVVDAQALRRDFALQRQTSYDLTTRLASLDLLDAAEEPRSFDSGDALARLEACARVLVAADLVGVADAAVRMTVEYCKLRTQFGVPIGSFQVIKHELADIHLALTLARHATLYAAHAVEHELPDVDRAVAIAKVKASDCAIRATNTCIQFHGGIGFTWEHPAQVFYKRARRLAGILGTAADHRAVVASLTI